MGLVVYITTLRAGKSCGGYAYQRLGYVDMKFNRERLFLSLQRSLQPSQKKPSAFPEHDDEAAGDDERASGIDGRSG